MQSAIIRLRTGGLEGICPLNIQVQEVRNSLPFGQLQVLADLLKGWSYREEDRGENSYRTWKNPSYAFESDPPMQVDAHHSDPASCFCFVCFFSFFCCQWSSKAQPFSETSQDLLISSLWLCRAAACFMCPRITRLLQVFKTQSLIQRYILNLLVPS